MLLLTEQINRQNAEAVGEKLNTPHDLIDCGTTVSNNNLEK